MTPIFLDCEASSLSGKSYPVEIAWSDPQGNIESHLINPCLYPEGYTDWDPAAQATHGLSRKFLAEHGESPRVVAKRMREALRDTVIYTDAADFDGFWIRRLFEAEGLELNFEFSDMGILLKELLPVEYWIRNTETCELPIYAVMKDARKQCGCDAHRAANDVAYLIRLYKNARKLAGYYE